FVSSVLPPGAEDLKGNEVETIIKFKAALGIDDPDAANVHMEIGRRIFRERLETGDREADMEQRKAFQKLIYVSNLVFGEASTFLLPWKRLFRVTDSQVLDDIHLYLLVDIAIRENAKRLYAFKLQSVGRNIDAKQLIDLRKAQRLYRLSDEIAAEMFREHTRKLIEENISTALEILKSRTKALYESCSLI
ncbi:Protein TIC110, chloroplastic, partial [Ananas comosus]